MASLGALLGTHSEAMDYASPASSQNISFLFVLPLTSRHVSAISNQALVSLLCLLAEGRLPKESERLPLAKDQMRRMTCLHLRDILPPLRHILQLKIFTHRLSLEGLVCGPG